MNRNESIHRVTPPRTLSALAVAATLGLALTACNSEPDPDQTPTATETETVETTDEATEEVTEVVTEEPTNGTSDDPGDHATETFTTQGGTFSFEVPEDWTAETIDYNTENVDFSGVPYEEFSITSPQGDIVIGGAVHIGPTSGDGWRSQHWQVADVEELDLPLHEERDHVYLRTDWEWLGEQDEGQDLEQFGWSGGDYRLATKIVSQDEELAVGDDDPDARLSGWTYWTPLPGDYAGEASFISVEFSQELIEALTGETEQEAAVEAFLNNEWYQTTTDILRSMEYTEPAEADLPITE